MKRHKKWVAVISELSLLNQAKLLDSGALAEIYDFYSPRLYRYALRLLGDACSAEDCVAETFSRFLQAVQAHRGPDHYLQAYLFRTMHNLVVDHYRRQPAIELMEGGSPPGYSTEESADQRLRQARVRAAIGQLTSEQQQVVTLKFLEGWDNAQIGLVLGKPIGAVKSLQHRALGHLQKILLDDET